jgi:serine-type D-Ala-D-Ala carboxypeptidase (penicillin-binding protein 5/6)
MARGERNRVLVAAGAVLIVAAAIYGPVALLAPLPATTAEVLDVQATNGDAPEPVLPGGGSAAVTLGADQEPIGSDEAVPIAAAAKILTALLVLDKYPLEAGRSGPSVPVTDEDFASYQRYTAEGVRSVRVIAGDTWTEREALHAMLLASSNNHAEMVARWAFGSLDGYLDAADAWLSERGLTSIRVADTTGLSSESIGSGRDLARLAALALADPFLAEAIALESATTTRGTTFGNDIRYRPEDGITGVSRSYTDAAGVCLLFAVPVQVGDDEVTVYGAFLGEPTYDRLATDMDAFIESAASALDERELVPAGTSVARFTTAWGATADAVTGEAVSGLDWGGRSAEVTAEVDSVTTSRAGGRVGSATVTTTAGPVSVPVVLDRAIGDPGPLWRFASPGVVVPRFVEWVSGRA